MWDRFTQNNLRRNNDLTDDQRRRTLEKLGKKGISTPSAEQVDAAAQEVRDEDSTRFKPGQDPSERFDGA